MQLRIKHFDSTECPTDLIVQFEKEFWPGVMYPFIDKADWFVVYENGAPWDTPIGYAGIHVFDDDSAMLCRCGITDAYRGQGLQRKLIQKRCQYAKSLCLESVYTYTHVSNVESMRNLIHNKFRPIHSEYLPNFSELQIENKNDDYVFWKKDIS